MQNAPRTAAHIRLTAMSWIAFGVMGCAGTVDGDAVVAITDVNVVTMIGDEVLPDHTVLIAGDRVVGMGPSGTTEIPSGAERVDGENGYLIPGLWDMHAHIFGDDIETAVFPALLAHGVTGVRDMNGAVGLDSIQRLKAGIRGSSVVGPTIVAPGPLVDAPGRSQDELSPAIREIQTPDEARLVVSELVDAGADFIKVYNRLTMPLMRALLEAAGPADIPVAGHVPPALAASELSQAGMASQEHLQGILEESSDAGETFRQFMVESAAGPPDENVIARFVDLRTRMVDEYDPTRAAELFNVFVTHGTAITPTLVSNRGLLLAGLDESLTEDPRWLALSDETKAAWSEPNRLYALFDDELKQRWFDRLGEIVRELDARGVPILAGTDLGVAWVYAGSSVHDELELLVHAGLEPHRALAAATTTPARFLGLDDYGTIEVGHVADLVLLRANPIEEISAIRDLRMVILHGRVWDPARLREPAPQTSE